MPENVQPLVRAMNLSSRFTSGQIKTQNPLLPSPFRMSPALHLKTFRSVKVDNTFDWGSQTFSVLLSHRSSFLISQKGFD